MAYAYDNRAREFFAVPFCHAALDPLRWRAMNRSILTTFALFTLGVVASAEVKVTVDQIADNRTTGDFFKGLELTLKLTGPELAEAKGMKFALSEAKDDAGTDISKIQKFGFDDGGFEPLEKGFGGARNAGEFEHKLKLPNPARAAKTAMVIGSLQLLIPGKDPASIITVDLAKSAGKALANPELKAAGATLMFDAPKADEASYKIQDSKGVVAAVEFCSPDGKALETGGRSSSSFGGGPKSVSISLRGKAPAGMVAKVYLVTAKSVVNVPIKLESITLP